MAAKNKTAPTAVSVEAFLSAIPDPARRADCEALAALLGRLTGEPPRMWGASIVGFGSYHYVYESGREGDSLIVGFASRKSDLTIYVMPGFETYGEPLARLGRHKLGKGCLYVKRLADLDLAVLESILTDAVKQMRSR